MNKSELRKRIRALKHSVSLKQKKTESSKIFSIIESIPQFYRATNVLLYHSLSDEVCTHEFIQKWYLKKNIFLPYVDNDYLQVRKYIPGTLKTGKFGIEEPTGPEINDMSSIDTVIVPGMAFDIKGNRLGRGKGYYDKLLRKMRCYKIGVCYSFQLLENIPVEEHDFPMDMVISPTNIIMCHD